MVVWTWTWTWTCVMQHNNLNPTEQMATCSHSSGRPRHNCKKSRVASSHLKKMFNYSGLKPTETTAQMRRSQGGEETRKQSSCVSPLSYKAKFLTVSYKVKFLTLSYKAKFWQNCCSNALLASLPNFSYTL